MGPRRSKSGGRKLYNEELHDYYSAYICVIKWTRITWAVFVAYMGEEEMHAEFVERN